MCYKNLFCSNVVVCRLDAFNVDVGGVCESQVDGLLFYGHL